MPCLVAADGGHKSMEQLSDDLRRAGYEGRFHGDELLADKERVSTGLWTDIRDIVTLKNLKSIEAVGSKLLRGGGLDVSFSN